VEPLATLYYNLFIQNNVKIFTMNEKVNYSGLDISMMIESLQLTSPPFT
jgi:hypothetical protein